MRTDGGTQFTSEYFQKFAEEYVFVNDTSSPKFPQSNGEAEKAVDIVKRILVKCKDVNLALLEYRNTPLESGLSPAELYSRKLRSTLPSINNFKPVTHEKLNQCKEKDMSIRMRNIKYFDSRNGVRSLPPLKEKDKVWISDRKIYVGIEGNAPYPTSDHVCNQFGTVRRNRRQ